jgi:tetratricopeptide (TPR) repeat protein
VNILVGCVGTSEGTAEQAIQDYDEAIRLNPQDADAYYNRTLAHTFLDMDVEAEQDFNRAVKLGVPPDILKRDIEILQSQR